MDEYIGCHVSLDCGDVLGTYQGKVTKIDKATQTISLASPFRNGVQCTVKTITLNACDIKDLKIVRPAARDDIPLLPSGTVIDPGAPPSVHPCADGKEPQRAPVHHVSDVNLQKHTTPTKQQQQSRVATKHHRTSPTKHVSTGRPSPTKSIAINKRGGTVEVEGSNNASNTNHSGMLLTQQSNGTHRQHQHSVHNRYSSQSRSPNSRAKRNGRASTASPGRYTPNQGVMALSEDDEIGKVGGRDSHGHTPRKNAHNGIQRSLSSSAPSNSVFELEVEDGDFDFETNLALFNKISVSNQKGSNESTVKSKNNQKYRCDENVLSSGPVVYKQINLGNTDSDGPTAHYVTDNALEVPCVSLATRDKILSKSEQCGITATRQIDMHSRSVTEMVMQLIGGSRRLEPKNAHQRPCIVLLCGEHRQGAVGLSTARLLACHNISVVVHYVETARTTLYRLIMDEMALARVCGVKVISSVRDLPSKSVDLIVNALDNGDSNIRSMQYKDLVSWSNGHKANVLSIDPPAEREADIRTQFSIGAALPLNLHASWGKPYLSDIGIPDTVYKQLGIVYQSPFASKFCIPLHKDVDHS